MVLLIQADGENWRLEVVGKLPSLPPFVADIPNTTVGTTGKVNELRVFERRQQSLVYGEPGMEIRPIFFEQVRYDIHFEASGEVELHLPPGSEVRRVRGHWQHHTVNFRNHVGFSKIGITTPSGEVEISIEVFPRKVDYRSDYVQMRDDLANIARNLAIAANARTYSLSTPAGGKDSTLVEWFELTRAYFDQFIGLTNVISAQPHSVLRRNTTHVDPNRARKVSRYGLSRALRGRGAHTLDVAGALDLPKTIKQESARASVDSPENRYYKALLLITFRNIQSLLTTRQTDDEDTNKSMESQYFEHIRPELIQMRKRLSGAINSPFLDDVGRESIVRPKSLVFLSHPAYSRIDKIARILNSGLSLIGGPVQVGVKDTAQLYEYWCFIKIFELLSKSMELREQDVVKVRRFRTTVTLAKGKRSNISFYHKESDRTIHLFYNKLFRSLPTTPQIPDNVIQLASEDRFYILDAKYRVQFDRSYIEQYGGIGPKTEDINTMHRYRDAIVIPHPLRPKSYVMGIVQGAIILFPATDESAYEKHTFFRSISEVEIGGLPFLPQTTSLVERKLKEIITAAVQTERS